MADLVTRLLLNNTLFNNSIRQSTQQVQFFLQMGRNISSTITKFAGALGVAVSASEIFNMAINSNSIYQNNWNDAIGTTKETIDSFFTSLASGDWSVWEDGILNAIRLSLDYTLTLRELKNNLKIGDVHLSQDEKELNRLENLASDESNSKAVREKAFADFKRKGKESVDYINGLSLNVNENITSMLEGKGIKADQNVRDLIFNYLDTSTPGGKELEQYSSKRKELEAIISNSNAAYSMEGGTGIHLAKKLEKDRKALEDSIDRMERLNPELSEAYKLKITFGEEGELDELLDHTDKIISLEDRLESVKKQMTDLGKDFDKNGKLLFKGVIDDAKTQAINSEGFFSLPMTIPETTLASLKSERALIIKKMNNSNQAEYIKLKVLLDAKDAEISLFQKGGGLHIQGLDIKQAVPLEIDNEKVNSAYDYADSLNAIASAMGAISSMTNEGALAWLTWSANLMTAIAAAIPAIQTLTAAKTAEAGANAVASATLTPVVGWLLAGAAAASVIAAMATMPKFADGGIFTGNSTIGDMNLARVNAGEMILNNRLQRNLFNLLNNGGSSTSTNGQVEFKIRGKELVGVLNNYSKKMSRV